MEQNAKPVPGQDSRRDFLKKTATAAAAVAATGLIKTPVYGQNQAPSANVAGANDKIAVGFIGVGGQGMAHVRAMKSHAAQSNIAQVAVCDVWDKRIEGAKAFIGGSGVEGYSDYRKLIDRKDIDAVVVATVDHWHTACSIDAMNAGKHVYVEKPMTRYLGEAFAIYDTCQKTKKVLQVGSQGCSDRKWHVAAEMIREGRIGPLVLGQGSYMRNSPKGEWNYTIDQDAEGKIDWKTWLGPVMHADTKEPNIDHYFRWRKYYPYCAGLLGDLFPHRLHPLMLATGKPEFPTRVVSIGNSKIQTDRKTPDTYMRNVPENVQLLAEFPSGLCLMVTSSTVNEQGIEDMIRGHHATLYFAGNRVALKPEKAFADEIDPDLIEGITPGEDVGVHERNWLDAIRGKAEANAGIDLAIKVQTVISLAEMSERMGVACYFDEKTRKVTTGPDNRVLQPYTYESEAKAGYRIEKV